MIYLVRHGETEYNKEGRLQGQRDIPLSELGLEQARELALKFKGLKIDGIFSSDLKRARQTALEVARYHDVGGVVFDRRLREIGLGNWEGKTYEELRKTDPQYSVFFDDPKLSKASHHESYYSVIDRVKTFMSDLDKCKSFIVVTHGFVIYHYLDYLGLNRGPYDKIVNCEIIQYDNKKQEIKRHFLF